MYNYFMIIGRIKEITGISNFAKDNIRIVVEANSPLVYSPKGKPQFERFEMAVPKMFSEMIKLDEVVAIKGRIAKFSEKETDIYLQVESMKFPERMTKSED